MNITLTVIEGPQKGKRFDFSEPDTFLLGRDNTGSTAHFRLNNDDTQVSRNHFLLEVNPPDCFIRDAGSLNGTFIVRPDSKDLFFLAGRNEDRTEYAKRAERLKNDLGFQSVSKVDDRLKLQDRDIIRVGQTAIFIEVTAGVAPRASGEQQDEDESVAHCIECGAGMTNPALRKKADQLGINDFICSTCQGKKRRVEPRRVKIACCTCGCDLTDTAHADGRADELLSVALYRCNACLDAQYAGHRARTIGAAYTLLEQLGEGGFGSVYLARHNRAGRLAAVKLTKEAVKQDERLIRRFKREIAIMQRLTHPNLVRLYDEGITPEGNYFFVSEYIPRGDLHQFCAPRYGERMPLETACRLISQALEGLAWFHDKGYVHRDIKPENILVAKIGNGYVAKLADFGLAKSYLMHGGTLTGMNEWIGSILFCPPEQILDFKNAHPCNDIYAMGMTLYHLLTGEFPYDF